MPLTNNKKVLAFVEESAQLAQPDKIVWIDGSEAQLAALREEAVKTGVLSFFMHWPGAAERLWRWPSDSSKSHGGLKNAEENSRNLPRQSRGKFREKPREKFWKNPWAIPVKNPGRKRLHFHGPSCIMQKMFTGGRSAVRVKAAPVVIERNGDS